MNDANPTGKHQPVPVPQDDKELILDRLMGMRDQGQRAEILLRSQKKIAEAEALWQGNARLSTEIDIVIGKLMDDWLGDAKSATKHLGAASEGLSVAIAKIKKQEQLAESVVKAVGYIDDAIKIAAKVLAVV